jgi:hypothetical protein
LWRDGARRGAQCRFHQLHIRRHSLQKLSLRDDNNIRFSQFIRRFLYASSLYTPKG